MRTSIWQQFSSNHSSSFTVVGEFEDSKTAHSAAEVFRNAARSIADWYAANEETRHAVVARTQEAPTPAELTVCQEYGIACEHALDRLANCRFHERIVAVYEKCVFVTSKTAVLCEGWAGEALFDQLMAKFALRTFVDEENSHAITVAISGTAPDPAVAQSIQASASTCLVTDDLNLNHEIPWFSVYLRHQTLPEETFSDYQIYLRR